MKYTTQDLANRSIALANVDSERDSQDAKWGEQNHTIEWMSILGEEFGEACQEFNRVHFASCSDKNLRAELIQVAAVAVAIVECLDRKNARLNKLVSDEGGV